MERTDGINNQTGELYWKEYGITLEEYRQLIKDQDGRCAICRFEVDLEPRDKGKSYGGFAVDHNHATGKVRGLLCYECDSALRHFQDSSFLVGRAAAYMATDTNGPTRASDITGSVPEDIKDYAKLKIKKDRLLLTGDTFFETLQGEGPTIGMPCVFARLHHCNLHCEFCDAFYSWKRESIEFWTEPTSVTFEEAAASIKETATNSRRVIWTGGEPLMQKSQIDSVVEILGEEWVHEIETNGTLMPTQSQIETFQFNCSPKLANNIADRKELRIRPKILGILNEVNTSFKFVCRNIGDLEEIEADYLPHISVERLIIMPEGVTEEQISFHAQNLYESVLERGWRMTPRFQAIFADGARRGV